MKKLMIIGPLPPPVHGESLAIEAVVNSKSIRDKYEIIIVDTNRDSANKAGKFAIKKILQDIHHIIQVALNILFKEIDIVYISISQTKLGLLRDLIFILISSIKRGKIITHLHGNNLGNVIDSFKRPITFFVNKILNKVNIGVVLGEHLVSNYRNKINSIQVIPNGVDINFITDVEVKEKLNRKIDDINILYLSNLIESKGYAELILAVISLLSQGYPIKLVLAGQIYNEDNFNEIWSKVETSGFEDKILYKGTVTGNKKKKLLLNADILVLPTNYLIEGQPLSIIEGMAAGNAIISTTRGSIPDLVDDNGILISKGEKDLIIQALVKLLNNNDCIRNMGLASRNKFEKEFTLKKYISNLEEVFLRK